MAEHNDGGPAFPTLKRLDKVSAPELYAVNEGGMTLRDWFAGQALAGLMAGAMGERNRADALAVLAYFVADALITERAKVKP